MLKAARFWCIALLMSLTLTAYATEWREATTEMSDGSTRSGRISLPQDKLLLYDAVQQRRLVIEGKEIQSIEAIVEKESIEEKWIWKEGGRDEKVYTGEKYPVRRLLTRVIFPDGNNVEGHVIGQSFKFVAEKQQNLILPKEQKGDVGQTLEELVYVKKIILTNEPAGVLGTISVVVKTPKDEQVRHVVAVNTTRNYSLDAVPGGIGEAFNFKRCTEGIYDIIVLTDKAVYYGCSAEKAENSARYDEKTLKEIGDKAAKVNDFFDKQTPVYGAGNTQSGYVLVRLERHGGTTMDGANLVRRYELWAVSKPEEEWQISKRFFIGREVTNEPDKAEERIVILPELAGHSLNEKKPGLTVITTLQHKTGAE